MRVMDDMRDARTQSTRATLLSLAMRSAILTAVWWTLTGGEIPSLPLGIPVSIAAGALSLTLAPPRPTGFRLAGLPPYVVHFATRSVAGGIDVARRALSPSMPIDPAMIEYPVRISGGAPLMVFANTISLLPGTLSARFANGILEVHALDDTAEARGELALLETKVAALFGQDLGSRDR